LGIQGLKIVWSSGAKAPEKMHLKPHCIRCCHFKVDDVSALEAENDFFPPEMVESKN
jgi:hypothetical protein